MVWGWETSIRIEDPKTDVFIIHENFHTHKWQFVEKSEFDKGFEYEFICECGAILNINKTHHEDRTNK